MSLTTWNYFTGGWEDATSRMNRESEDLSENFKYAPRGQGVLMGYSWKNWESPNPSKGSGIFFVFQQ